MSEAHKHVHHRHLREHAEHSDGKHAELKTVLDHIHGLIHSTLERHDEEDSKLEARHAKELKDAHLPTHSE